MARGFGGGGGGRSFGGGGGGRSFGSRSSSGKSSFSSSNFSSYKRSGGASPSSGGGNFHKGSGLGNFIAGAIIGSIFNGNKTTTTVNTTPQRNQVFPEMNNQTLNSGYTPPVPPKEPKYREFMFCDYCEAEYNDLKLTKCENCGAQLKLKREEVDEGGTPIKQSTVPVAKTKKKNTAAIVVVTAIAIVVVAIILVAIFGSSSSNYEVMKYDYDIPTYDDSVNKGQLLVGDYLSAVVYESKVVYDLSSWGIEAEGTFVAVRVEITNVSTHDMSLYISDLVLCNGTQHAIYASADMEEATINSNNIITFDRSDESDPIRVFDGESISGWIVFPVDTVPSNMWLDICECAEYGTTNDVTAVYRLYLS